MNHELGPCHLIILALQQLKPFFITNFDKGPRKAKFIAINFTVKRFGEADRDGTAHSVRPIKSSPLDKAGGRPFSPTRSGHFIWHGYPLLAKGQPIRINYFIYKLFYLSSYFVALFACSKCYYFLISFH